LKALRSTAPNAEMARMINADADIIARLPVIGSFQQSKNDDEMTR
jgi:hypothetical protein